jgi:uncharacterized protein (DUF697 family)
MISVTESLVGSCILAAIAYGLTIAVIPTFSLELFNAGLKGKDLNKPEKLAKEMYDHAAMKFGLLSFC